MNLRNMIGQLRLAGLALLLLVGLAMPGQAAVTFNGMTAIRDPSHPGVFEVLSVAMAGPTDYWCAAGDFTVRWLGQPPNTRIYLVHKQAPSRLAQGRRAVTFTILPDEPLLELGKQDFGYSLSISKPGYNFLAGGGRGLCTQSRRWLLYGRR